MKTETRYYDKQTTVVIVHSVEQKSIGLKFSKSQTGSRVTYSCHHNSSCFTFLIFKHSWRFSLFHSWLKKEGREFQKLKTDLPLTVHSLNLSWVEAESLYPSTLTVRRRNPGSWMRASNSIIIIINFKDWTLWSVPSPGLHLLLPTYLRSSNCSPSLWSLVVWFQRVLVLWRSLQV